MQAFDGKRRDELAIGEGMLGLFGASRQSEVIWVLYRQSLEEINLLQGCFDRPSIVLVGEVEAIVRARNESRPKSATLLALLQTWDIYMASESALLEKLREVIIVDFVFVISTK